MKSGDVMEPKAWANRVLRWREWMIGSGALLLLLSAGGLTLLAQHAREESNVVTGLLALNLAFWSYVLGIVGLVVLPVLKFIEWLRMRVKRAAMSRYSSAEPRRRHLAKPEPENSHFLRQEVAPVAPSRSSMESKDKDRPNRCIRVA
jgi:hypothetical protein